MVCRRTGSGVAGSTAHARSASTKSLNEEEEVDEVDEDEEEDEGCCGCGRSVNNHSGLRVRTEMRRMSWGNNSGGVRGSSRTAWHAAVIAGMRGATSDASCDASCELPLRRRRSAMGRCGGAASATLRVQTVSLV